MFDNRDLRLDLFALGLLAIVVFLGLALITYDPADPLSEVTGSLGGWYAADVLVHPQHEKVHNACGRWGALVADLMFNGMGIGAYYLVFSLAVIDVLLLRRRAIDAVLIRTVGWLASLAGLTTLAAMIVPHWSPGPVIGSGGYLGALGAGLLQMHFAAAGGMILVLSLIIGGLLLCTDYTLPRLAGAGLLLMAAGVKQKPRRRKRSAARDADPATDEDALADDDFEDEGEFAVRIRGKRLADDEADGDELDEEPWDEDADVAAEDEDEQWDEEVDEGDAEEAELGEEDEEAEPQVTLPTKPGTVRRVDKPAETELKVRKPAKRTERDEVIEQLNQASLNEETQDYELPSVDLLIEGDDVDFEDQAKEVRRKAKILEKTFSDFGFKVKVVEIETGPVIAQYEVQLEAGLRLSRITGLADDLAIALRVPSVRIVAPIPGKNTVGIEVPNETRQVVRLREVIEETNGRVKKMRIPLFLGKDVSGNPLTVDLSTLPHLLIAGRTGTGKSVCLNAIISSILMTRRPDEVRMLMIDPKMVELSGYGRLPHLMHPVVTDMRKAEAILAWAVDKMEERYSLLAKAGVRHISSYNQLGEEELFERLQPEDEEQKEAIPVHLPFIVIVADEMADLMMTAGKEVEQHIIRLAQKSRAVGIHLILATQKPTVDVITGLIKSNLPARISFQVASRTDSRVVLDEMGADKLLGNGDMLFLWPGTSSLLRGQGTYLSDDEINSVVDCASTGEQNFVNELVNMKVEEPGEETTPGQLKKRDELYESAVDVVVREGRGSVSLLQRSLGIGYGRAARLVDFMAEDGIVGDYAGSQAREVLISISDWERMQGLEPEEPDPDPPKKKARKNKVVPEPEPEAEGDNDDEPEPTPPPKPRRQRRRKPAAAATTSKRPRVQLVEPPEDDEPLDDESVEDSDETAPWEEEEEDSAASAELVDEGDAEDDEQEEYEDDDEGEYEYEDDDEQEVAEHEEEYEEEEDEEEYEEDDEEAEVAEYEEDQYEEEYEDEDEDDEYEDEDEDDEYEDEDDDEDDAADDRQLAVADSDEYDEPDADGGNATEPAAEDADDEEYDAEEYEDGEYEYEDADDEYEAVDSDDDQLWQESA